MTVQSPSPRISFNSARFLTSASRLSECPADTGIEIAFAGRSNAGKSSALNTLTRNSKLARTSKTPGRTRLINFFSLNQPDTRLVDLPGYGYAKVSREMQAEWQHHLSEYLHKRQSLRAMTLIMDVRHPLAEFDQMMIEWCEDRALPMLLLLTKADKLKGNRARQQMAHVRGALRDFQCVQHIQLFSALKNEGVDEAREAISPWLDPGTP